MFSPRAGRGGAVRGWLGTWFVPYLSRERRSKSTKMTMVLFGRWAEGSQSPVPRFPEIRICGSSKWEVQSVCLWSDEGTPRRWRQLRPAGSPVPRRAYLVADGSCLLAACTYVPACRSPATVSIHTTHITRWHVVYSMFKGHGDGTPGEREKNTAWFDPSTLLHMNYFRPLFSPGSYVFVYMIIHQVYATPDPTEHFRSTRI